MVLGSGLLAKAFTNFNNDNSVIVFASGVSNSLQSEEGEYQREFTLLKTFSSSSSLFIYFSTCSVFDHTLEKSPYILHKLKTEKFIRENFTSFIIFRLPILVGKTSNPHTLTNYIFNRISDGGQITVFKNACRFLMDVDDVQRLLTEMIRCKAYNNKILNIHFNNRIFIPELILLFEKILGKKSICSMAEKGGCYTPDNRLFSEFITRKKTHLTDDYYERVIRKYYGNKI